MYAAEVTGVPGDSPAVPIPAWVPVGFGVVY